MGCSNYSAVVCGQRRYCLRLSVDRRHFPALTFCPHGKRLIVGTPDHYLRFYWMDTGERAAHLKARSDLNSAVTVFPDVRLSASGGHDGEIYNWDVATQKIVRVLSTAPYPSRHFSVTVSSGGKTVASAGDRGGMWL